LYLEETEAMSHCAGEGQQKFMSVSQTPLAREEMAPFQNTERVLERTKIWSWVQMGSETKNYCAGEGQRQVSPLRLAIVVLDI
jgi:hypothetical protein